MEVAPEDRLLHEEESDDWEEEEVSSSLVVYVFLLCEGVDGAEGGGVRKKLCSGMRLYRPSFDRKSLWPISNDTSYRGSKMLTGMPQLVLIPAPVMSNILCDRKMRSATSCRALSSSTAISRKGIVSLFNFSNFEGRNYSTRCPRV